MSQITITTETEDYFGAIAQEGAYTWTDPGIDVPADVRVAMELLHEVLAGATLSVSRQGGRVVCILITTGGSSQILNVLEEALDDAISSHDKIKEEDGYLP
jgi:hypothetical protein